jgi:hypothetical protein
VSDAAIDAADVDAGACTDVDGGTCGDIDECALGTDDCDATATCANTVGGFTCTCPEAVGGTGHGVASCSGPRFTDLGNRTVRDNHDGAVWQQEVDAGYYTQAEAIAYCAALILDGAGWRLPTVDELWSLVDTTRTNPSIDPTYFPGTSSEYFWSSSSVAGWPTDGWNVVFNIGYVDSSVAAATHRARCVR